MSRLAPRGDVGQRGRGLASCGWAFFCAASRAGPRALGAPMPSVPATTLLPRPSTAAQARGIELPSDEVLVSEFEALGRALQAVSGQLWRAASSSTVLMRDVFSQPKFYKCCPCYLHLLQHSALKSVPEAIVEGTGGVWDCCAAPGRPLSFEAGVREAVVCWNAPRPLRRGF